MELYFWIFAAMAIGAGIFTITAKDALPSALGLLTVFISLASLYLHLQAPLVAVFQITIYAGAILVLVVFVIMLLMTPEDKLASEQRNLPFRSMGAMLGGATLILVALGVRGAYCMVGDKAVSDSFGSPKLFGSLFFKDFLMHFEVVSVLLLVALIGAIYLSKKNL